MGGLISCFVGNHNSNLAELDDEKSVNGYKGIDRFPLGRGSSWSLEGCVISENDTGISKHQER